MNRVAVVGATGYAGAELVRLLSGHPDVELTCLTSRQYAGQRFDQIYPAMAGRVDLGCETYDADMLAEKADIVFTALPHEIPMRLAPELLENGLALIDLSADFRFRHLAAYESSYQDHAAPELLGHSVYGLSEVYTEQIRSARLIGNPGCYPTSVLLPLVPLVKAGLIDTGLLIADAKSGVSGAGRGASLTTHFCQVNESFKAYKVAVHRHNPEMEEVLADQAGKPVALTFVPHLVPMTRGMATTIYTRLADGTSRDQIVDCLKTYYQDRPFVRVNADRVPDTLNVKGTNCCDIGLGVDTRDRRLILLSVIDNLVKGAAGQAVQNMNLMLGLDETRGLWHTPAPL